MYKIIAALLAIIASICFIVAFVLLMYAGMHVFNGSPVCFINIPIAIVLLGVAGWIYRKLDHHA